ncbi:protein arginine N-methyltransferase 7-like [Haliotis rubra]|uniref:protein arginine N-methyltransferase 7-like n=1 Tax=Haliotis rubra TaxID=36100 RepID=UPI001EE5B381|nr:protein arginine N-methyltransferase 7-like [Haliotis rubra]
MLIVCVLTRLLYSTEQPLSRFISKMSTFVSHANPVTGKMDWIMQDENYDYHQEIARSAYADMLHDTERNQKYYDALKIAIKMLHDQRQKAHVLDIGTGTGLLSMMAASAGADSVTACEAFKPMAKCAAKIMQRNKLGDKINLIPKRSTELTVGPDGDMHMGTMSEAHRANVLVKLSQASLAEVFGAIGTFNHAHKELLVDDCIVIPRADNMFAQPVSSDLIRRWNQIDTSTIEGSVPGAVSRCGGAPSLHDLQLDQIPEQQFTPLSTPLKVFRFDFNCKGGLKPDRRSEVIVSADSDGAVDAVFMWWDCEMDPKGEITLSCAPRWAHPDGSNLPWRDHWMQAIYYPSNPLPVTKSEPFTLVSCHDEYSLWFDATKQGDTSQVLERPLCTCAFHTTLSRTRIGMMGDPHRVSILKAALKKHVKETSVCLCISDGSLLSVMAASRARKVFVIETNPMYKKITDTLIQHNSLRDRVTVIDKQPHEINRNDLDNLQVDVVVGEPYFSSSVLPWHNVHVWYAISDLEAHLAADAVVLPGRMVIKAVAMDFDHLWKIRAPVGVCEGFDITEFDRLIESSSDISDSNVEPQPLWEYPGKALSSAVDVVQLHCKDLKGKSVEASVELQIETNGCLNGIALWTEYEVQGHRDRDHGSTNKSPSRGECGLGLLH